jgi:hypothetical protein
MRTAEYGNVTNPRKNNAWARFEEKRRQNAQAIAELHEGLEDILEAFRNASSECHTAAVDMLEPVLREQQLQAVVLDELLEDLLHEQRAAKVELATAASAWPRARGEDLEAARAVLEDCSYAAFHLLSAAGGSCALDKEQPCLLLDELQNRFEVSLAGEFCDEASSFLRDVWLRLDQGSAVETIGDDSEVNELAKQYELLQRDSDDLQDLLNRANEVLSSTADSWLGFAEKAAETAEAASILHPTELVHPETVEAASPAAPVEAVQPENVILLSPRVHGQSTAASPSRQVAVVISPTKTGSFSSVSPPPFGARSRSSSPSSVRQHMVTLPPRRTFAVGERRPLVRMSSAPCLPRCGPSRHSSPTRSTQPKVGYSAVLPGGSRNVIYRLSSTGAAAPTSSTALQGYGSFRDNSPIVSKGLGAKVSAGKADIVIAPVHG